MPIKDLTGQRFGKLVAIKACGKKEKKTVWLCKCDCGNEIEVVGTALSSGNTKSCGCITKKHGMFGTRIYNVWHTMKERCYVPSQSSYKNYGGRGIKVCDEWKDNFKEFYNWAINGWKKGLTLDRINNDDDYKPDNCRWVDRVEQANNRHTNYLIKYKGEIKTMAQWSKILKIDYSFIQIRMYKNKTMEEVVEEWNLKKKK